MEATAQNVYRATYTRPDASGQSAARLVRYLTRRPEDKERPGRESDWHSLPEDQVFGNAERFKEAANRRRREQVESSRQRGTDIGQNHSAQNVSYLHVVISPRSREEFRPEDFEALIDPWIRDRRGRRCEYFAAIHYDDPEGPKMHVAIARDRIHKTKELPRITERTNELVEEREILLEISRYPEHTHENDQQRDLQPDHEAIIEEQRAMTEQRNEQREEEAHREAEEQARQQEEARREETHQDEEQRIEERRRARLEREARELEEEHEQEM